MALGGAVGPTAHVAVEGIVSCGRGGLSTSTAGCAALTAAAPTATPGVGIPIAGPSESLVAKVKKRTASMEFRLSQFLKNKLIKFQHKDVV
jgi:hypothetical protein